MPEPLVCEDSSLTRLMETVNETPGARILYQDTVRRGGVFGFFAREVHRVAYIGEGEAVEIPGLTLPGSSDGYDENLLALVDIASEPAAAPHDAMENAAIHSMQTDANPFAALLAEADAAEADVNVGRHRQAEDGTDFASILRRYTEPDEIDHTDADQGEAAPVAAALAYEALPLEALADVTLASETLADVTPIGGRGAQARNRLELLVQLRQVGVPVSVNPGTEVQGLYHALEDILDQLPPPAELPTRPGTVLAIVGEVGPALRAARTTAKQLRLPTEQLVVAGVEDTDDGLRRINGRRQAARLRQEASEADLPFIVVIATDGGGADEAGHAWANDLLDALRPDQSWTVMDARWKPEDCHSLLDRLPGTSALVVHAAELSASPASVWDLDLPLALLDDRRPSTFVWLSLLMRLFGPSEQRHRATA